MRKKTALLCVMGHSEGELGKKKKDTWKRRKTGGSVRTGEDKDLLNETLLYIGSHLFFF